MWLADDLTSVGLWLVGYPAAKTRWGGHAMPLSERADNVLGRLLTERRLETGNIVFVAHSLGGLVVEHLIRSADRDSGRSEEARAFLSRVRRVAFLGTPHRGSLLANLTRAIPFVRASAATLDLTIGNPQLRDLNRWYRRFCDEHGLKNLLLVESRPERLLGFTLPEFPGKVVSSDSADAGLPDLPISVDESHTTICKPPSRDAEVYQLLKSFIQRPFDLPPSTARSVEALERNTAQLEAIAISSRAQSSAIDEFAKRLKDVQLLAAADTTVLDAEVDRQLQLLLKRRFFLEFNTIDATRQLLSQLDGELAAASQRTKSKAFAWCARLLSADQPEAARSLLAAIAVPEPELVAIANAFITRAENDLSAALAHANTFDSPMSRSVAYICVLRANGFDQSEQWLQDSGWTIADLDSDGRTFYISGALESLAWTSAINAAKQLQDDDFDRSPILLLLAAHAHLAQAVPHELRMQALRHVPARAADFPLRAEPESMLLRRTAASLYGRAELAVQQLEMAAASGYASDHRLWLRLVDPDTTFQAREELAFSIRNPTVLLRRFNLARQFGIEVDLAQVEKEVNRQTARSGGNSPQVAMARFSLALAQNGYAAAADYLQRHRKQLLDAIDWRSVYFFEIEALAKAGRSSQAEDRFQEAVERGLTADEAAMLRATVLDGTDGDTVSQKLSAYDKSQSLFDLREVVEAYQQLDDWGKAVEFGKRLVEKTGDIVDVRRYVYALYKLGQLDDVLHVLTSYPALSVRFPDSNFLRAQTLYERGDLREARSALHSIRQSHDSQAARNLQVNLAVTSGDWESLQVFVEGEWSDRGQRTPMDLVSAGQIAQLIEAPRARDLVREAAARADGDADVLVHCYQIATKGGWEIGQEASRWLQKAAALSDGTGESPIRSISLEELIERQPAWNERENNIWNLIFSGDAPLFAADSALNQSHLSTFLLPAISNPDVPDARKRSIVLAYSGSRGMGSVQPSSLAMDPTSLITAELLGILDLCIDSFDKILIPHGTLSWMLQERARIPFHQPSRISAARELRRLIAEGKLRAFEVGISPPDLLVNEVGEHLAELLVDAASPEHPDKNQRLVVRGGPIFRASTFMKEEADVSAYFPVLVSCAGVVKKLEHKGILTSHEAADALADLAVRERVWPNQPEIEDGAILYLDDLAASHLHGVGLLGKLHRAGITALVARGEVQEADALIAYDARGTDVLRVVDRVRSKLKVALDNGNVRLARVDRLNDDESDLQALHQHPTAMLLKLANEVDACVADDRFINQHSWIQSSAGDKPLLSTLDLLEILQQRGLIGPEARQQARATLRRATYALIPLEATELMALLDASSVEGGRLVETGELRAIRENIQRVRMSDLLQLPKEANWLHSLVGSTLLAIRAQWNRQVDESIAIARSDWLLALGDVRGWAHRFPEDSLQRKARFHSWLGALVLSSADQPKATQEAYWRWLDSRLLEQVMDEDSETYEQLVHQAGNVISELAMDALNSPELQSAE